MSGVAALLQPISLALNEAKNKLDAEGSKEFFTISQTQKGKNKESINLYY